MAVISPPMGGKPDALAMPKHKGKAIRETKKPEIMSLRPYFFRAAKPSTGFSRTRFGDEEGVFMGGVKQE
jgi:hypothetical protein